MARCPLCSLAADAGGHWPAAPAWMCIAWGAWLSSPLALSVTVATLPLSWRSAFPEPSTRLVGTGGSLPDTSVPDAFLPEEPLSEEPPPRATTATMPATRARPAATGHSRPMPFLPSEGCEGRPGGPPCAAAGGCAGGAGGGAEGAGGCAEGAGGCAEGAGGWAGGGGGLCGDPNPSPVPLGGWGGGLPEPCAGAD